MSLTSLYRKIVPEIIRKKLYKLFVNKLLDTIDTIKHKVYYYFFSVIKPWNEKQRCFYFMGKYFSTNYPYDYYFEYMNKKVDYQYDDQLDLPFVIHNNKRLYFKKMSRDAVEMAYRTLLMEQDQRSAHCYEENYQTLNGKTILDIGTAEGIFALNVIDYAKYIYMFECEPDWIKPLNATFSPYKEKISITEKYVSDSTVNEFITVDSFFEDKNTDNIYIKMDIEGFESKALNGSISLFSSSCKLSGAICVYHKENDKKNIVSFLEKYGCRTTINNGYIYNERTLRAGVVQFTK